MHAEGATHQDVATARGIEMCTTLGLEPVQVDLSSALTAARRASSIGSGNPGTAWSAGQLVSYLRTPVLYYHAALLSEQGSPCVVVGTTNRDEGCYIGFFGKASDGMVDIQPISDLHKSEVYKLGKVLGVSTSVMDAVPTGDTWDGMSDEDMIGTGYDFLELFEWSLCQSPSAATKWLTGLGSDARNEFELGKSKLEMLHRKNKHKYIGDSPAVHLDVLDRAIPGGWKSQDLPNKEVLREEALNARVGPVEIPNSISDGIGRVQGLVKKEELFGCGESAFLARNILSQETCAALLSESVSWKWVETDIHGRPIQLSQDKIQTPTEIGSYRATAFDESLSDRIWDSLRPVLPIVRTMTELTPTDHNGYPVWRPVGINPMFRFIRYQKGGYLVPHYDSGFDFHDSRFTLMSVVITIAKPANAKAGGTRFLLDKTRNVPMDERHFADWHGAPTVEDILFEVPASVGDAVVFDHRLLHDASLWEYESPRIILRTDVIFKRCGSHAISPQSLCIRDQYPEQYPDDAWTRDPTYRKAYRVLGSTSAVFEAGYFDDGLDKTPRFNPELWTAPLGVITNNLSKPVISTGSQSASLAVLVTTGSFCPLHTGHIDMMNSGKLLLEQSGKTVLGGFIVPDHDSYVSRKCGDKALNGPQRIQLAESLVRETNNDDWLVVDHWTALYAPADINFTAVIDRIAAQLALHIPIARSIEIIYVCGGDNANFALSFVSRWSCLVVSRPGFENKMDQVRKHPNVIGNGRIIFDTTTKNTAASTNIRNGNTDALPVGVMEKYSKFINSTVMQPRDVSFYMRHEDNWAVAHWSSVLGIDREKLLNAYRTFCVRLTAVFKAAFKNTEQTHGTKVHIVPLHLKAQEEAFNKLAIENRGDSRIISLDPCLPAPYNLALSRCFPPLSVGEDCEYLARPGSESLETQLSSVTTQIALVNPQMKTILFDDDTLTGGTGRAVTAMLANHNPPCLVTDFITLCNSKGPLHRPSTEEHHSRLNLIDCRDFLVGTREGGLVVQVPTAELGGIGQRLIRVPYVLPFVRPVYRASIPVEEEMTFSRKVWELNRQFFIETGLDRERIENGWIQKVMATMLQEQLVRTIYSATCHSFESC
jgi:NAD+ synthetase